MLIYLALCAMAAFVLALVLAPANVPAAAHAAFALGALPLIAAAMAHFVPVLTRSGAAERAIQRLPLALQAAGALAVATLAGGLPGWVLHFALSLALVAALRLLGWLRQRARACLGRPHPGLAWYAAALGGLIAALGAIFMGLLWPPAYAVLRLAHVHLNTLGFIGLTALGTLQVLLPTVLGQFDPGAGPRLKRLLPWLVGAVALLALAGLAPWLAVIGGGIFGAALLGVVLAWIRRFGAPVLLGEGAALCGATLGLLVVVLAGIAHGLGGMEAAPALPGFFALFLLPLVSGALAQLLPVWRYPGPAGDARRRLRTTLMRFARVRTLLFIAGGLLLLGGVPQGGIAVAMGGLLFVGMLGRGLAG